jgi:hypothetical protein
MPVESVPAIDDASTRGDETEVSLTAFHLISLAALAFLLVEGLLRKAVPPLTTPIVAFKYVLFPGLCAAYLLSPHWNHAKRLPIPFLFCAYLAYGVAVTAAWGWRWFPETHFIGAVVNLAFVPMALIGAELFSTPATTRVLMRGLVLGAAGIGLLAVVQSRLSGDHWLNVAAGDSDLQAIGLGDGMRVDGGFPNVTVLGNFTMCAMIGVSYIGLFDPDHRWRVFALFAGCLALVGGLLSGSRTGFFGAGLIALTMSLPLLLGSRELKPTGAGTQLIYLFGFLGMLFVAVPSVLRDSSVSRAASSRDLFGRIDEYYFGETMRTAYDFGGVTGAGWGPVTNGVQRYVTVLGGQPYREFDNDTVQNDNHRVEGGYSCLMLSVGAVGLALFVLAHGTFLNSEGLDWSWRALGLSVGGWSLLGNLPFQLQEIGILAIWWWLLAGVFWGARQRETGSC